MRKISIHKDFFLNRFSLLRPARWMLAVLFLLMNPLTSQAAEKIAVFPATPYYGFIIYESLAVFWLFIISLLVIIRMKLREIERIQEMGADREDGDAPFLE